jgi:multidrug resistance protein MdtO
VIGSAIGGLVLGIGCLAFAFPNIEGVPGFLMVIAALAFLGAWIGASPYFGYIGLQTTYAFNLLAFERFSAPNQMTPARDRLLGIALGFLVMFVIFHQVRPERTVDTMRRLLARLLRAQAELIPLLNAESNAARNARTVEIKKQVAATVVNLQSFADVVKFEFPPDRAADMRLSNELLNAVASAADLLICLQAWPQGVDKNERSECLTEIRNTLEDNLRGLAHSLEQLLEAKLEVPERLNGALENCRSIVPICVLKTIDSYRELQMACIGIVRLAA